MTIKMCFLVYNQKNYRQHIDQVKYSPVTDTPDIILAKKNAQLVSNVSLLRRHHLYQPLALLYQRVIHVSFS